MTCELYAAVPGGRDIRLLLICVAELLSKPAYAVLLRLPNHCRDDTSTIGKTALPPAPGSTWQARSRDVAKTAQVNAASRPLCADQLLNCLQQAYARSCCLLNSISPLVCYLDFKMQALTRLKHYSYIEDCKCFSLSLVLEAECTLTDSAQQADFYCAHAPNG
eukprot:6187097-Pleurochrysis_carterae.AAC.1